MRGEKQGEIIGSVRMNEKLRKRNSSLWLELASLETEEELKMFLTGWWRRQGSLLVWHLTVGESEITIGDTRIAHGGTKHQSTKWREKTEYGNKPFDNPCELLRIEIHLYLVWFAKNVSTIFWESIDRHFAMKEESSQFSAYWIGLLCGWEGLVCQHGA